MSWLIIGQERIVGGQLETASMWQEQEVVKKRMLSATSSLSTPPVKHLGLSESRLFIRLCHVFNLNLERVFSGPSCLAPVWLFGGEMTQNGAGTGNGTTKKGQELKIVIVGDGGCGKTSLLMVYAKGDFPEVRRASMSWNVPHLLILYMNLLVMHLHFLLSWVSPIKMF